MMVTIANDEIWFFYNNAEYQIVHESSETTAMYITKYYDKKKVSEHSENFPTANELLDNFKIAGKTLKEICKDVSF